MAQQKLVNNVNHGFPKVPSDVEQPHILRRFLQALRDALQNYRWLFEGLSGLTQEQQTKLVKALLSLAGVKSTQNKQQATIDTQTEQIGTLQQQYQDLSGRYQTLQSQYQTLDQQYQAILQRLEAAEQNITNIQDNCCPP